MKYATLSDTIKTRRKELGISQKDLANKIGTYQANISDFENNKSAMGSDAIDLIFEILKLKVK